MCAKTKHGGGFCAQRTEIIIPLESRIVGRQVPKPRCLGPAANSLYSRIVGRQVPKPRCLSPTANSLYSRIAGGQPRYLSSGTQAQLPIACIPRLLVVSLGT